MGRDETSVVDGQLRVYGIDNLRVADGSIMLGERTRGVRAAASLAQLR
jgi:choline dehydrogenase-like flavoprotein